MRTMRIGGAALAGALALGLGLGGCDGLSQAMTSHTDAVARAAGHELTVDEAAAYFELDDRIRPEPEAVEAIAGFWTDYVLLATVANDESLIESLDLTPVIEPQIESELVQRLRQEVIQVDTSFTEEELREIYETEQPNLEVRARHILLQVDPDASTEERDSVRALASELRDRARAGESFGDLAAEYSEDTGSASRGGDLGYFTRGRMVAPFEDAAFSLEPDEVSDVVETPFGYHVIQVVDRRMPDYEETRDEFAGQLSQQRVAQAEQAYVQELTEPREITVQDDVYDVVRQIVGDPDTEMGRRARNRALVTYDGGEVTAGELGDLMRRLPRPQRMQYEAAEEAQFEQILESLARNEIILAEAQRRFPELATGRRDSIRAEIEEELMNLADQLGLIVDDTLEGDARAAAVERAGAALLEGILQGQRGTVPLGAMGYALRESVGAEIFERNFSAVQERVREQRAGTSEAPATPEGGAATDPAAGDSSPATP
ncbi:MAG: peptidylprolyl isomerase [Gemmatimonadota bacterium]